ncbi:MAG: hypothetical protein N2510_10030, partial [Ignavibacteria bacterium]|nr:hypothetical protein [Ignavibacteria bacterium]
MKKKILIIAVLFNCYIFACPYCNAKFYEELFTTRSGSLLSEELIKSINNQKSGKNTEQNISLPKSPVIPAEKQVSSTEFIEIIERDNRLPIPPTSYVNQNSTPDKKVTIELSEGEVYIGNGVLYKGFTTNNNIPGPTIILDEGDIVLTGDELSKLSDEEIDARIGKIKIIARALPIHKPVSYTHL